MPTEFNPKDEFIIKSDVDPFKLMSGRQMYEQISYTGINRSPVIKLQSFILAGLVDEGSDKAPFRVEDVSERLLVDGTVVWYKPEGFLDDIISASDDEILLKIRSVDGNVLFENRRRLTKVGDKWEMYDEKRSHGATDWAITKSYPAFDDDSEVILVHENGVGILFYAQYVYQRIEEIQTQLRRESTGAKTKSIVSGFTGDVGATKAAFEDASSTVINVPGNVTVTHPSGSIIMSQMISMKTDLMLQYNEMVMNYISNEASDMSGTSRRLMMSPMLQFVSGIRKQLADIFDKYKVELQFDKVQVQTVEERTAEYALLKSMRDDGVMEPKEFQERAKELA